MKTIFAKISLFFSAILLATYSWAQEQDKKLDVDIDINKGGDSNWYQQPWVWVVGGALFILILVAIVKSGSKSKE